MNGAELAAADRLPNTLEDMLLGGSYRTGVS
jgi:hypothetical protein